jgi:outer membrane murein-binding lipoprotein Lpp
MRNASADEKAMKRLTLAAALLAVALLAGSSARAVRLPAARGCPVFPRNNPWNQRVDKLPVAADSAELIASIGLDDPVHADFGSGKWDGGPIGIPFDVVSARTPRRRVSFEYADESDRVRYPIPAHVHIEGGAQATGDRHALLVDRSNCRLYELYDLRDSTSGWAAGSGAVWNLRSNHLRPAGWTSADAAGLPIFPGLARWDEVSRGVIDHALRFTAPRTRRAYVYPARHYASSSTDPSLPPMGLRVRLKASVNAASFPRQARVVLRALQRYGMILADNGSPWYVSGAPNRHWNNDALHTLGRLTGADFEVVDTSSIPEPGK